MSRILGVHGIGQQFLGAETLRTSWAAALDDGVSAAGGDRLKEGDFACAFYGDLFRPKGQKGSEPDYNAADIEEWEEELLREWASADTGEVAGLPAQKGPLLRHTPLHGVLEWVAELPLFGNVATPMLIADLKQVRRYLFEPETRLQVRARMTNAVHPTDTHVVVAHSLGSVVAYETLCAHPEWKVKTLVTIGSPLGSPKLIFPKLDPAPMDGTGEWPGSVETWINIADRGDVVALHCQLAQRFGERVKDVLVDNGAEAHDATRYLTARETGEAILTGL